MITAANRPILTNFVPQIQSCLFADASCIEANNFHLISIWIPYGAPVQAKFTQRLLPSNSVSHPFVGIYRAISRHFWESFLRHRSTNRHTCPPSRCTLPRTTARMRRGFSATSSQRRRTRSSRAAAIPLEDVAHLHGPAWCSGLPWVCSGQGTRRAKSRRTMTLLQHSVGHISASFRRVPSTNDNSVSKLPIVFDFNNTFANTSAAGTDAAWVDLIPGRLMEITASSILRKAPFANASDNLKSAEASCELAPMAKPSLGELPSHQ